MLKQDIVNAVQESQFHIWSVNKIEEGIEVLTGVPAGKNKDGSFDLDGFFARVNQRLAVLAEELVKCSGETGYR